MTSASRNQSGFPLLPRELLLKSGPVDEGQWYYHPLLKYAMQRRIDLLARMLAGRHVSRLLDLGYGSGILLPGLATYCQDLHGIDIHGWYGEITHRLASIGIQAQLVQGTAIRMPFATDFFDVVVAMSTLEFIDDVDGGLREIARVLRPNGCLIWVSPRSTQWGDWGLRLLTRQRAKSLYFDRRERFVQCVPKYFEILDRAAYSPFPRLLSPVYEAGAARPIKS